MQLDKQSAIDSLLMELDPTNGITSIQKSGISTFKQNNRHLDKVKIAHAKPKKP